MAKKMAKLPKGVVLYAGRGKYVGEAPEELVKRYLESQAKAKAAAAEKPVKAPKGK